MPAPSPTLPGSIGEFIRERREALGMTATDLGDKLGVHQTTVSRWERSRNLSRLHDYLDGLAEVLDESPDVMWDLYRDTLRGPIPGWLTRMMVRGSQTFDVRTNAPAVPALA